MHFLANIEIVFSLAVLLHDSTLIYLISTSISLFLCEFQSFFHAKSLELSLFTMFEIHGNCRNSSICNHILLEYTWKSIPNSKPFQNVEKGIMHEHLHALSSHGRPMPKFSMGAAILGNPEKLHNLRGFCRVSQKPMGLP